MSVSDRLQLCFVAEPDSRADEHASISALLVDVVVEVFEPSPARDTSRQPGLSKVEPRGFEPLTSAVQMLCGISVHIFLVACSYK